MQALLPDFLGTRLMPPLAPALLLSPETKIQYTIAWKVWQALQGSGVETAMHSGDGVPLGHADTLYSVLVAHSRSRSSPTPNLPAGTGYNEDETLTYRLTVRIRNHPETIATDLVATIKRALRGFVPIVGNKLRKTLEVNGSDLKGSSGTDHEWTIDTSIELRRSESENFELLDEVARALAATGATPIVPLPEGFVLGNLDFGVWRSPAPVTGRDGSVLDREMTVEVEDGSGE